MIVFYGLKFAHGRPRKGGHQSVAVALRPINAQALIAFA